MIIIIVIIVVIILQLLVIVIFVLHLFKVGVYNSRGVYNAVLCAIKQRMKEIQHGKINM